MNFHFHPSLHQREDHMHVLALLSPLPIIRFHCDGSSRQEVTHNAILTIYEAAVAHIVGSDIVSILCDGCGICET